MAARIWFKDYTLEEINRQADKENILTRLGIRLTELGPDYIRGTMPVDDRTRQPFGILHGGASCVLAETLGSFASVMCVNQDTNFAVGSVITTNHLRPVESGTVEGLCKLIHLGKTKHVWEILITNESGKLVARSELTCAVTDKKQGPTI